MRISGPGVCGSYVRCVGDVAAGLAHVSRVRRRVRSVRIKMLRLSNTTMGACGSIWGVVEKMFVDARMLQSGW